MFGISRWLVVMAVFVSSALIVGGALATQGSGVTKADILARGTASERVKTRGNEPFDAVVQHVIIAPGGHTGWHTHPGQALVVIKAGTLTIYDGHNRDHDDDDDDDGDDEHDAACTARRFTAGKVYVDPGYGHVHIGRNETNEPLELYVTYLDVPPAGSPRIDVPNPGNCPF